MTLARQTEAPEASHIERSYVQTRAPKASTLSLCRLTSILVLSDMAIVLLTGAIPVLSYNDISSKSLPQYLSAALVGSLIFVAISSMSCAYESERILQWNRTIRRALMSLLMTFLVLILAAMATKVVEDYSRVWFYSWFLLSGATIVGTRVILLASAEAKLAKGAYLQRALIVSCVRNKAGGTKLTLETDNRIRVVGTITALSIDTIPDLKPYICQLKPEIIILNLPWAQVENAITKLKSLSNYSLNVLVLPESSVCMQKVIRLRHLGRQTLLQIVEPPLADWDREKKRAVDVIVASLVLLLCLPFLLLVALAIKIESKGPVLFKQVRVGFNGDLIEVWKFRSMYVGETDLHASRQTSKDDPRVTRVGRFIRRTSIDEIPQFWNVLQGQMSVVGPRPHALGTSADGEALEMVVDEYSSRHRVKPGITGWAQVNGARGELRSRDQLRRRVEYDLYYIDHWSVMLDIKIILMTFIKVLHDNKAY